MTPKAQRQRQKRHMKLSQTLKLQIIGNNQQNEKQEKIDIANHYLLPDKGLIPKIYKLQIKHKFNFKMGKDLEQTFLQRRYMSHQQEQQTLHICGIPICGFNQPQIKNIWEETLFPY